MTDSGSLLLMSHYMKVMIINHIAFCPPSLFPSLPPFADGERGPPSHTVDQQRNRILATAALKKAEPLAAQGTDWLVYKYTRRTTELPEFSQAVTKIASG